MPLTLAVGQTTHPGRVRETNEDAFCVLKPPQLVSDFDALLAVADGMGGHQAGEVASKYASDKLNELFTSSKYREWVNYSPDREDYQVLVLKEVIEQLNEQIHQMASRREEWRGMGTTATISLVVGARLFIGHVGDSRAYLLSNGVLRQLTTDHSWVWEQVQQGTMSPEQAAADPRKNQITRALGVTSIVKVDRLIEELRTGDTLLLCTDGLTNMVSDAEIHRQLINLPDPQRACDMLVQLANQNGGGDNITVVIARVMDGAGAPPAPQIEAEHLNNVITQPLPAPLVKNQQHMRAAPAPAQSVTSVALETPAPPTSMPETPRLAIANRSKQSRLPRAVTIIVTALILGVFLFAAALLVVFLAFLQRQDNTALVQGIGPIVVLLITLSSFLNVTLLTQFRNRR
ncbi:MAG: Stp1/IreP family PP2C-type Ser/Thr phosphatase [Chloroflexota bacterium]|nr:Stp1/IreP family PP2C-type Ser/Thr phosphatase [Chloroflexota bacterium]